MVKDYKAYYKKYKDRLKANAKKWAEKHREELKEYHKKWAEKHREELKEYHNNYKRRIRRIKESDLSMTQEERLEWLESMNQKGY